MYSNEILSNESKYFNMCWLQDIYIYIYLRYICTHIFIYFSKQKIFIEKKKNRMKSLNDEDYESSASAKSGFGLSQLKKFGWKEGWNLAYVVCC